MQQAMVESAPLNKQQKLCQTMTTARLAAKKSIRETFFLKDESI